MDVARAGAIHEDAEYVTGMHELGMCEAVMDAVEKRAGGRVVQRVRLRIGVLHRVVPDSLDQAFAMVATGTVADGAEVDLVTIPVQVTCRDCGHAGEAGERETACAACASTAIDLEGGDELTLESLQLAPETAPSD